MMRLLIIDEFSETLHDLGFIDRESIIGIIELAERNGMLNISLLDLYNDTYFNIYQLVELENEINGLVPMLENQKENFEKIREAIRLTMREGLYSYLKFEVYIS